MISNNMIRLAANSHQTELHRGTAGAQHSTDRGGEGAAPAGNRLQRVVVRMFHTTTATARRAREATVVPRISI